MRNFILLFFSSLSISFSFAQTGPGGVGTSANIEAWMDASGLSFANGNSVNDWSDSSGNGNDASDVIGFPAPTFQTNQINGHPVVDFAGGAILQFSSNITTSATTIFSVHSTPSTSFAAPISLGSHLIVENSTQITPIYKNPTQIAPRVNKTRGSFSIFSLKSESGLSGVDVTVTNGTSSASVNRNEVSALISSNIGCRNDGGVYKNFSNSQFAELIVFNEVINSAKRKIVSNHLAAKYNLTPEQSLYAYASTHGTQVIGIGQETDGSHTESRGKDSLLINNPSSLGNGDYILIGNDNNDFSISTVVPLGINERWNRTWKADITGTPGTIDVQFFLGSNGFAATSDYVVLIEEADGDFTNGGTRIHEVGRSFDAGTLSISFTGLDLADGASFTLAEKSGDISSIANGNWENTSTWDCTCVPGELSNVVILHNVTINNNESVSDISLNLGSILFGSSDSLFIYGDFINDVNAPLMAGTIVAANTIDFQTFSGSGSIEMNNLQVNSAGLTVEDGDWTILNNIQVSAGSITGGLGSNVVLASSASQTSQILPSVNGAFSGDFTVERFISARSSNYSNMAAPISNATAADLDGELVLSGIGGNNGNAQATGGGTFNSMWFFDSPTDDHIAITSTSTALPSGVGFEVFLDTVPNFSATTVTYEGTPFSGPLSSTIVADQGWNLIGNPYHSFIDVGALDKGSIPDDYWIYNSSTGSYDFVTGASNTPIAPGQGFWLDKSTSGNQFVNFDENDKVDNTSSAFVRKKKDSKFKLILSSTENNYSHQMAVTFDYNSTAKLDELDARYLPSPLKEAPAIYSKATNSDKGLIVNSLDAFEESHIIPVEIYAGVDGAYTIDAENMTELYDSYSCVYLKDKVNNQSVDLSVEPSYQFESTKGASERFELIVSNSYVECEKLIEDGSYIQELDHNLELRNAFGDWYLDYTLDEKQQQVEIRILNMNGQEVREAVSFGASNAGTYRLQNLQDLNGIYLIQIRTKDGFLNKTVKL